MVTLRIALNCYNKELCLALAEFILSAKGVKADTISYSLRTSHTLDIKVTAPSSEAFITKRAIISAYREWVKLTVWKHGRGSGDIRSIVKLAGKPFILDALVEVLRHLGYEAKIVNNELRSKASWDTILEIASLLANRLEELVKLKPRASYSAKALITSYSVLAGCDIGNALKKLEDLGFIKITDYRIVVSGEWRGLLRKLASALIGVERGGRVKEASKK